MMWRMRVIDMLSGMIWVFFAIGFAAGLWKFYVVSAVFLLLALSMFCLAVGVHKSA